MQNPVEFSTLLVGIA